MAQSLSPEHPLHRAAKLLQRWRALADTVPVHDLLDRIFFEADVMARYAASVPAYQVQRVCANLQMFLELSLDIDSGRYPSLTHFLHRLRSMRSNENSAPDEPVNSGANCVRFLTIHASKGLEAPVIFLTDCNAGNSRHDAHTALVDWPADSARPEVFQLVTSKAETDRITGAVQHSKALAQARENLNLLYVALTRARQFLYLSGAAAKQPSTWYSLLEAGMQQLAGEAGETALTHSRGDASPGVRKPAVPSQAETPIDIDPALLGRLQTPMSGLPKPAMIIAPSRSDMASNHAPDINAEDARLRGRVIHRALELLAGAQSEYQALPVRLGNEFGISADDADLRAWLQEARDTLANPEFDALFRLHDAQAFNELPVLYRHHGQDVYGIIDRLVMTEKSILLIDYKSHQLSSSAQAQSLAQQFAGQMYYYREGVQLMWPQAEIRSGILFTALQQLVWL